MKKLLLLCSLALSGIMHGQTLQQSMYIDFGPTGGSNGGITASPDANGHYWNNATNPAQNASIDIVNSINADTGIDLTVTDNFVVNTANNYGPAAPTSSLLGDLAIGSATQDYFYLETGGSANSTGQLTLTGLNPQKGYKFHIFGSRPTNNTRISEYTLTGLNSFTGRLETSNGTTGNLDTTLATSMLTPTADGRITIDVAIIQNAFAYINVLKIEEFADLPIVDVTGITVTGSNISVSGQTTQMVAVVSPDNATFPNVTWTTSDSSIAVISSTGLLTPVGNGTVTVMATSAQNTTIIGSATISISNQNTVLYFNGSATESGTTGTAIPMHMVTGTQGTVSNMFELYTSLNEEGTFNLYTSLDDTATVIGAGASAGQLAANGAGIDPTQSGPVLIRVNLSDNTYTITPINWSVTGSSIANGWSGDAPLMYQGNGIWSATVDMTVIGTDTNPRFVFRGNQSWDYVFKKVTGSQNAVAFEDHAQEFGIAIQDIDLTYGNFIITLNLANYTYGIECVAIDENKIAFMGSSVMNGQGGTNMQGYAYLYNQLLTARAANGSSPFYRYNVSVNGNNTAAALARVEKDLLGSCSQYVIFGLALGNEGIHENGQPAFDSYGTNLQTLIQIARDNGRTPLVVNNYVRADYNAADYNYVKQMNIEMAQWDVPSINSLGATDNGTGNWVNGYWSDALHPNDAGHAEMAYAIVPSLFDALEAEKPQPVYTAATSITPNPVGGGELTFTPENLLHPFTTSISVKTTSTGNILGFTTSTTATGNVAINAEGFLTYTSPSGTTVTGTTTINDGNWHTITLTHYYGWGRTQLYVDATAQGNVNEQIEAKIFKLHGAAAPANVEYRNWFFYRAGMNDLEIEALSSGTMLKSSLELYAPLNGEAETPEAAFANLAQSTNNIDSTDFLVLSSKTAVADSNITAYPNPVIDTFTIKVPTGNLVDSIYVYNSLGMEVASALNTPTIDIAGLQAGIYIVKVKAGNLNDVIKVIKK